MVQNQGFNVAFSYYPLYYSVQLALVIDLEEVSPLRRRRKERAFSKYRGSTELIGNRADKTGSERAKAFPGVKQEQTTGADWLFA